MKLRKLLRADDSPHRLALAFALGVLLGILPGTGAVMAAGLATALRLNIPLAVAGAMLTNPLTAPLVYGGSYFIGHWLLGRLEVQHAMARILLTTIAGNLILSIALALVGYGLIFGTALLMRKRRQAR